LYQLEMWANAQRDGRPAKHRWRPLKLSGVPQTNETISAASGPKFTVL